MNKNEFLIGGYIWVYVFDEPIQKKKKNGRPYLLSLYFHKRYGYEIKRETDSVVVSWDNSCGCFRESTTKLEIDSRDISGWWKDI